MKAIWGKDYDWRTDKCFDRPNCPDCQAPIGKDEDGVYRCFSCGEEVEVMDEGMKDWFAKRDETKIEQEDCFSCKGRKCMETHMYRNIVTLEWQAGWGECKKCGVRFIV